jgi:hypothetical protein
LVPMIWVYSQAALLASFTLSTLLHPWLPVRARAPRDLHRDDRV